MFVLSFGSPDLPLVCDVLRKSWIFFGFVESEPAPLVGMSGMY